MRRHTVMGGEVLRDGTSDLVRLAHDIALRHHERWDGRGYPHGLAGEAIPVAARIDGREISVRDKGPLFAIYPFDERPELFNETYFGRSVWQVARIEVIA